MAVRCVKPKAPWPAEDVSKNGADSVSFRSLFQSAMSARVSEEPSSPPRRPYVGKEISKSHLNEFLQSVVAIVSWLDGALQWEDTYIENLLANLIHQDDDQHWGGVVAEESEEEMAKGIDRGPILGMHPIVAKKLNGRATCVEGTNSTVSHPHAKHPEPPKQNVRPLPPADSSGIRRCRAAADLYPSAAHQ